MQPAWRLLPLALLLPQLVAAQALRERAWLPLGSAISASLARQPAEDTGPPGPQVDLGRLLFRTPDILGGNARRAGVSCNACHPAGHRNAAFFIAGLSSVPGTVDVSHAFWNLANDNGIADPLPIPSLRGAGTRRAFGREQIGLEAFIKHVIEREFAGTPSPGVVTALTAYVRSLRTTPEPDRAITLETDMEEARHNVELLADLAQQNDPLTALAAAAVRTQLGRMAARFIRPEHGPAIQQLGFWAADLRDIQHAAETGDYTTAAHDAENLGRNLVSRPLLGAVSGSLYDPNELERIAGP